MATVNQIRERAEELCKIFAPSDAGNLNAGNEFIIMILMKEFSITREEAEEHFINNKTRE